MKVNLFDVIKLKSGNKATILALEGDSAYRVEIVDDFGKTIGFGKVVDDDIEEIIYKKINDK